MQVIKVAQSVTKKLCGMGRNEGNDASLQFEGRKKVNVCQETVDTAKTYRLCAEKGW